MTARASTESAYQDVPLSAPAITEEDIAAVMEVMHTPTLSIGPRVRAFEEAVAAYTGVGHAVAVNSGTSGLHVGLAAAGVGAGDEVITSPFSFVASANCAIYQGAKPVFVDIEPNTLNMDPNLIEAAITERTRAIIPVDVFGQPGNIEAITAVAQKHNLAIIQDSCEAIGAERNGIRAGAYPGVAAAVFAFYPNKQMTTGEGGIVVTDSLEMANAMRSMANQGRDDAVGDTSDPARIGRAPVNITGSQIQHPAAS